MSIDKNNILCPSRRELEVYYLTASASTQHLKIKFHLYGCTKCMKKLQAITTFYKIFYAELHRPPLPSVLDFCKQAAPKGTKYGLLICSPHPEKNNHYGNAYWATLAFSANGNISQNKLSDFRLPKGYIGVMTYTDIKLHKLLLFVYSSDKHTLAHYRISIPGILEKAFLNPLGAVKIDLLNFELLNNHLFYLKQTPTRPISTTPLETIKTLSAI